MVEEEKKENGQVDLPTFGYGPAPTSISFDNMQSRHIIHKGMHPLREKRVLKAMKVLWEATCELRAIIY